jgi:hypothetical protein
MFDEIEINNNVKKEELYNNKTWIHGNNKDNIIFTIFLITISSHQLEYSLQSINNFDLNIPFVVNCIKDVSPTNKAYNEMRLRCKTKYFIQNDEDMELYSNCLSMILKKITENENEKNFLYQFKLIDDILGVGNPPIIDSLKVYKQDIMKLYPTFNNGIDSISSVDSLWHTPILKDNFIMINSKNIIGFHGLHRSNFDLLLRYCKIIKSLINPNIISKSAVLCKILKPLFEETDVNNYMKKILYLISKIKDIDYNILQKIIIKLNSHVNKSQLLIYNINRYELFEISNNDLIYCDKNIINNINKNCYLALIAICCICTNNYEYSFDKYPYEIYDYFFN